MTRASALGLESGDLSVSGSTIDQLSIVHVRVQQSRRGIPVFGGEAIVHYRSNGELIGETNDLVPNILVDTKPRIDASDATARAIAEYGCSDCLTGTPNVELWVIRHEGRDHLAYRVRLRRLDRSGRSELPVLFIDAHDGRVVLRYDNLQTGSQKPLPGRK